uniref:Putative product n=1 Tax=Xenopsylla cheopis TaxID=163159 RepID=A0A6M2DNS1_XENCH
MDWKLEYHLLQEYKNQKVLWSPPDPEFDDKEKCQRAFMQIYKLLNSIAVSEISLSEVQNRIISLLEKYKRYKNNANIGSQQPSWVLFESMDAFLGKCDVDELIKTIKTIDITKTKPDYSRKRPFFTNTETNKKIIENKVAKFFHIENPCKVINSGAEDILLVKDNANDEDYHFGMYTATKLRKLSKETKRHTITQIMKIFNMAEDSDSLTQQF